MVAIKSNVVSVTVKAPTAAPPAVEYVLTLTIAPTTVSYDEMLTVGASLFTAVAGVKKTPVPGVLLQLKANGVVVSEGTTTPTGVVPFDLKPSEILETAPTTDVKIEFQAFAEV